jgi:S1-C subfamily serine protease
MYHNFDIKKRSGKSRVINAPDYRLKMLQRKIADLLTPLYRRRNPVHGFVIGRSVKTNAQSHLGSKFIVNLDLKDFFPSISYGRVTGVLRSLGMKREFAKDARCIYTRYADDLSFSSYQPLMGLFETTPPASGHFSPDLLSEKLKQIFSGNGFVLNPDKAHYADKHSRRTVTGIRINEALNVDRRFVRNLRAALYSVETLGLAAAQAKFKSSHGGKADVGQHLQGKVSWLGYIKGASDPVFRSVASRFNAAFPPLALDILPSPQEIRERSVWLIEHWETGGDQGTAFFMKGVGLVTAEHCVSPSGLVELYHPSKPSNKFPAYVKHRCPNRDLAVLDHAIPSNEFYELETAAKAAATGEATTAIGYPGYGPGDRLNIRPGAVTSLPTKSAVKMVEVQQMLTPGMSGGPLLDVDDRVVGVVHKGGHDHGRQLAIAISELHAWLP